MSAREQNLHRWAVQFFSLTLSHENLLNIYNTNFMLMYQHNMSLSELENMMPWERDIYISLLVKHLQEKEQRRKAAEFKY